MHGLCTARHLQACGFRVLQGSVWGRVIDSPHTQRHATGTLMYVCVRVRMYMCLTTYIINVSSTLAALYQIPCTMLSKRKPLNSFKMRVCCLVLAVHGSRGAAQPRQGRQRLLGEGRRVVRRVHSHRDDDCTEALAAVCRQRERDVPCCDAVACAP